MTATQWFETLASFSLQVLVLIAVCKLLERALVHPSDRCALWNLGFLCVLALACAAVLLPRLHILRPWSWFAPQTLVNISAAQGVIAQFLLAVWCFGAAVSLLQWLIRAGVLQQTLRRCEPLPRGQVESLIRPPCGNGGDPDLPTVLISDEADGPFCWQFHRPTVVLPRFLLEGSQDDLRHILVHELEHLRGEHPLQLFWQQVAQVVCWFHPAVWRAGSRASLMREFVCDEAAARHGADSAAYLRTLLRIAERYEQKRNQAAIGFVKTPSEISLRARRLAELAKKPAPKNNSGRIHRRAATCILLEVTCLLYFVCLPLDSLASPRSVWSPWPSWTASSLHCFSWNLRDYEQFDRRVQPFEITHHHGKPSRSSRSVAYHNASGD
jgi:beta-lactamase regulating signal transducer with metallopeptidase domain